MPHHGRLTSHEGARGTQHQHKRGHATRERAPRTLVLVSEFSGDEAISWRGAVDIFALPLAGAPSHAAAEQWLGHAGYCLPRRSCTAAGAAADASSVTSKANGAAAKRVRAASGKALEGGTSAMLVLPPPPPKMVVGLRGGVPFSL